MPLGDICSGISFRYDDSIFVSLAEPCVAASNAGGGDWADLHAHVDRLLC